ncbi:MAG TPA: hypothetical protein VK771_10510 [Acidimicrobiia bacterium]|nr:hypothetical protein [Acidimicrobiia bacterium]
MIVVDAGDGHHGEPAGEGLQGTLGTFPPAGRGIHVRMASRAIAG